MKIKSLSFLFFILLMTGISFAQMDISFFPKANAIQKDTMIDRWGTMQNAIILGWRTNLDDDLMYETSSFVAEIEKGKTTFILFSPGGSGNDIWIYPITECNRSDFQYDYEKELRHISFNGAAETKDRMIQIDDLQPGYYYIHYLSCHFGISYVLQIKDVSKTP